MAAPTASKNGSALDALDEAILGTDSTIVYNASKSPATARWQFSPWSAVLTYVRTALLATVNAFTKQQNFTTVALTSSSAHIAWDLDVAQVARHTATENTTLDNPTNMVAGGTYIFKFTQHASSAKTLAFGNAYKWAYGVAPVVSTGASAVDIFTFVSDGTNMYGVYQQAFA